MRKQLPTDGIANELAGSSVFFQPAPAVRQPVEPAPDHADGIEVEPLVAAMPLTNPPTMVAPSPPGNHATPPPPDQPGMAAASAALTEPVMFEDVRKAVRQIGKEAATHRFTADEKRPTTEIVYTRARQGTHTSHNVIARIAVNGLLLEHRRSLAKRLWRSA